MFLPCDARVGGGGLANFAGFFISGRGVFLTPGGVGGVVECLAWATAPSFVLLLALSLVRAVSISEALPETPGIMIHPLSVLGSD